MKKPRRRNSLRLPEYDYTQAGYYFVTLTTKGRVVLFQDSAAASIVEQCWSWLADQYDYVELDEYAVMPNHLHGIVVLTESLNQASRSDSGNRKTLGRLMGAFKTVSTKRLNQVSRTPTRQIWQRNFYERVIRNEPALSAIREYIRLNPLRWDLDPDNPSVRIGRRPR